MRRILVDHARSRHRLKRAGNVYKVSLDEAAKIALRDAIRFLVEAKGLAPDDAYAFASVAVDLHVTQIVDTNKGIHAMIPKGVFR